MVTGLLSGSMEIADSSTKRLSKVRAVCSCVTWVFRLGITVTLKQPAHVLATSHKNAVVDTSRHVLFGSDSETEFEIPVRLGTGKWRSDCLKIPRNK